MILIDLTLLLSSSPVHSSPYPSWRLLRSLVVNLGDPTLCVLALPWLVLFARLHLHPDSELWQPGRSKLLVPQQRLLRLHYLRSWHRCCSCTVRFSILWRWTWRGRSAWEKKWYFCSMQKNNICNTYINGIFPIKYKL